MPKSKVATHELSPADADVVRAAKKGEGYGGMTPAQTKKNAAEILKERDERLAKKAPEPVEQDDDEDEDEDDAE